MSANDDEHLKIKVARIDVHTKYTKEHISLLRKDIGELRKDLRDQFVTKKEYSTFKNITISIMLLILGVVGSGYFNRS